jgi:S-DNA-T family DNA segregation ATPase FtsK/SpoIIIE
MIFDKLFKKDKDSGKTTETKPVSAVDYYAEGKAQFNAGRYTQAMEYFQAAISEHPERENAYLKLAETFLAIGKQKEASSTLYKLLARYPESTQAQEMLKKCQPKPAPEPTQKKDDVYFSIDDEFDADALRLFTPQKPSPVNSPKAPQPAPPQPRHFSSNDPYDPYLELPNYKIPQVDLLSDSDEFKQMLLSDEYQKSTAKLPIVMGWGEDGKPDVEDLAKMPHLMIAGMTNYGAPTFLNGLLLSILFKKHPADVKLVLMGDKRLQLSPWPQLDKHFLAVVANRKDTPVIDDKKDALRILKSLSIEMDSRFDLMKAARVRRFDDYNEAFCQRKLDPQFGHRYLQNVVVVIFELNGLWDREFEDELCHLSHLAHTVGIHIVTLTNQPLIYTPEIQANIPTRLAFKVSRLAESNAILGESGAQNLKQIGESIYKSPLEAGKHIKCLSISDDDIENVVGFISKQRGFFDTFELPEYYFDDEEIPFDWSAKDEFFNDAARLVVASQFGSTSLLQRKLQLGYNRAGRIIDQLEAAGIVGPSNGSKPRDVLIHDEVKLEELLRKL